MNTDLSYHSSQQLSRLLRHMVVAYVGFLVQGTNWPCGPEPQSCRNSAEDVQLANSQHEKRDDDDVWLVTTGNDSD